MRFSIRDLLWLTMLAAVLAAWWLDRSQLIARYRDALAFEHRKRTEAEEKLGERQESFLKLEQMWMRPRKPSKDGITDFD